MRTPGPRKDRPPRPPPEPGAGPPGLGAVEVGRTLGRAVRYAPEPLEDQLCEECQNSVVTVILSSAKPLHRLRRDQVRISTTDREKLRAAIEAGTSAGAHWPRNSRSTQPLEGDGHPAVAAAPIFIRFRSRGAKRTGPTCKCAVFPRASAVSSSPPRPGERRRAPC